MIARVQLTLALGAGLILVAGCQASPRTTHGPSSTKAETVNPGAAAELGVEQLATAPEKYVGHPLSLRGVVASTAGERRLFTVIDEAEYKSCGELSCAAYQVPVSFTGALPDTARLVRISGRLEQPEPGRYVVLAERVEALP